MSCFSEDKLPCSFANEIESISSNTIVIRSNIRNLDECNMWITEFGKLTNTNWNTRTSKPCGERFICSKRFVCHHSSFMKVPAEKNTRSLTKNSSCLATINIKVKLETASTKRNDPFIQRGLLAVITLYDVHNHSLNTAEVLKFLPAADCKEKFFEYFNNGMSIAKSCKYHESILEFADKITELDMANSRINPPKRAVQHWYDEWRLLSPKTGNGVIEGNMDDLKLSSDTAETYGCSERSEDSYTNLNKENIQENGSLMQTEESEELNSGAISTVDDGKRLWTEEEALNYVVQKVGEYLKDRKCNRLLDVKLQIDELKEKFQKKKEELEKLEKAMEGLYKSEVIFLQHIGAIEKTEAKSVGVYVDLPVLPENASLRGGEPFKHISENVSAQPSTNRVNRKYTHTPKKSTPKKTATESVEYIDLTDDVETSVSTNSKSSINVTNTSNTAVPTSSKSISPPLSPKPTKHPAPLPLPFFIGQERSDIPPKPQLRISIDKNGITLQWDMPQDAKNLNLSGFDIFGYQEKNDIPAASSLWTKIGRVNPMPLPMSCVLTQFVEGSKYHFSIRAVAIGDKVGHFSEPGSVLFLPDGKK